MDELLIEAGLSDLQAAAYLYLLEYGESTPPTLAKNRDMTRTNAYKVLDSLEELGLANKAEVRKKFVYRPADPTALASLVAEERNRVIVLEQNVRTAMQQLRSKYRKSTGQSRVEAKSGSEAMVAAYEQQAELQAPIYFIKSRADIPFLGYETMNRIRHLPVEHGTQRYGITPDGAENPATPEIDKRTNLQRTWIPNEDYVAPVEWSVSGKELLIHVFDGDGRYVRIEDAVIADAFQQIWQLVDKNLRGNPAYRPFSPRAKRHQ